jgi:O-6-methylguanine DNA methyltransferase
MPKPDTERTYAIPTSLGRWRAVFTDTGLRELSLPGSRHGGAAPALPVLNSQEGVWGRKFLAALRARLAGKPVDLPWEFLDLHERPPFHLRVWRAMYAIPFGAVRTYGQIAAAAGSPRAVRAVGQACGSNPIVLFIPCHRVVATGGPGGFGSGLEWKRKLLELEGYTLATR